MKIREYRKRAGLTQKELAEKLNISRQSISKWETGETVPSLDNIISLSRILEISIDELLTGEEFLNLPIFIGKKGKNKFFFQSLLVGFISFYGFRALTLEPNYSLSLAILVFFVCFLLIYPIYLDYTYNYWLLAKDQITFVNSVTMRDKMQRMLFILFGIENKLEKHLSLDEIKKIELRYEKKSVDPRNTLYAGFILYLFKSVKDPFYLSIKTVYGEAIDLDLNLDYQTNRTAHRKLAAILRHLKKRNIQVIDDNKNAHHDKNLSLYDHIYGKQI